MKRCATRVLLLRALNGERDPQKLAALKDHRIRAMAHKLARILLHLLKYREPFNPEVSKNEEVKMKRRKLQRLQNMAASFNSQLVPHP